MSCAVLLIKRGTDLAWKGKRLVVVTIPKTRETSYPSVGGARKPPLSAKQSERVVVCVPL